MLSRPAHFRDIAAYNAHKNVKSRSKRHPAFDSSIYDLNSDVFPLPTLPTSNGQNIGTIQWMHVKWKCCVTFSVHEELRVNDTTMRKMALALNGGLTQRGEASLSWEPSHVCVLDLLIKIQFPRRSPSPTLPPPRSTSLRLWGRRSRPDFLCTERRARS